MATRRGALEMVRADASSVPNRRNRVNFFELAYRRIEDLLVNCELKPGRFLTVQELQAVTGFGRTPVQNARQPVRGRYADHHPAAPRPADRADRPGAGAVAAGPKTRHRALRGQAGGGTRQPFPPQSGPSYRARAEREARHDHARRIQQGHRGIGIAGFSIVLVSLLIAAAALYTDHKYVLPFAAAGMLIGLLAAIFILPEVYGYEHD
jgi:Bacterial regulatory proteins, gntR family